MNIFGAADLRHLADLVEAAEKVFYDKTGMDKTEFLHIPEFFLVDDSFWGADVLVKANFEDGWISVIVETKE